MSCICAIRHLMKLAPESVPPMRQAVFFAAAAAFFYPIPIFMAWMVFRSLQNGTSNSLLALFFRHCNYCYHPGLHLQGAVHGLCA